jgi:hypothetical protein
LLKQLREHAGGVHDPVRQLLRQRDVADGAGEGVDAHEAWRVRHLQHLPFSAADAPDAGEPRLLRLHIGAAAVMERDRRIRRAAQDADLALAEAVRDQAAVCHRQIGQVQPLRECADPIGRQKPVQGLECGDAGRAAGGVLGLG